VQEVGNGIASVGMESRLRLSYAVHISVARNSIVRIVVVQFSVKHPEDVVWREQLLWSSEPLDIEAAAYPVVATNADIYAVVGPPSL
jgi:hypothetical protein